LFHLRCRIDLYDAALHRIRENLLDEGVETVAGDAMLGCFVANDSIDVRVLDLRNWSPVKRHEVLIKLPLEFGVAGESAAAALQRVGQESVRYRLEGLALGLLLGRLLVCLSRNASLLGRRDSLGLGLL